MPDKIEIKSCGTVSEVLINGTDISRMCVAADIKLRGGELPKISFECIELETITYMVEHGSFHSEELIRAATAILRTELMKHGDLYKGYLASINSALKEKIDSSELWHNDIFIDSEELAQAVISRIIGEEYIWKC